jgi:hypothetical protein
MNARQLARRAVKVGLKPIGLQMTRSISPEATRRFTLMEHLGDRQSASVAQVEWQCMGHYCHIEVIEKAQVYYIWVGPQARKIKPRTLSTENVVRVKGHVPKMRR